MSASNDPEDVKPEAPGAGTILVTGGAGFIGAALVRALLARRGSARATSGAGPGDAPARPSGPGDTPAHRAGPGASPGDAVSGAGGAVVVTADALTYAADPRALRALEGAPRHRFERVDLREREAVREVFEAYRPDVVVHLAAESHVDRSIDAPLDFVHTNLVGTAHVLEEARRHRATLEGRVRERFRLIHVSTDEVFGPATGGEAFTADSPYAPSSPYAATKAGADHMARAWGRTYGLPVTVVNLTNVYGPGQHPEKLIPVMILAALEGRTMPVYGDGLQVRDWLHVDDAVEGLLAVLERGRVGATHLLAGRAERRNLDVVRQVADIVDALVPGRAPGWSRTLIRHVDDRPGHDRRYALDDRPTRQALGWRPRRDFDEGLRETVRWYLGRKGRSGRGPRGP